MKILVLHRIPYHKIEYHRGIDHLKHEVYYVGSEAALATIPESLRCVRWLRNETSSLSDEVIRLIELHGKKFDLVVSLSEYELLDAALIRDHFSISGPGYVDVVKVRDKLVMKACVEKAGLVVPANCALTAFELLSNDFPGKVVLKPIDGASSENVLIFPSANALAEALHGSSTGIPPLDAGDYEGFEVEAFVSGDILHFDGLMVEGEIKLLVSSQYLGNCLKYAEGEPLGSYQIETTAAIERWVNTALSATAVRNGCFHVEAIREGNTMVFLELANRVGGADVCAAVELATGVHLPSAELKVYLGEAQHLYNQPSVTTRFGWFVFPGHQLRGERCRIEGSDTFRTSEQVVRWSQLSPQQTLAKNITYQAHEVPLAGLVRGDTSQAVRNFMAGIFNNVTVA